MSFSLETLLVRHCITKLTGLYHTIKDYISHNPLPGLISTHCLHLCLIYPVCSPYISLVQFVILCKVLCVSLLPFCPQLLLFGLISCVQPLPVFGLCLWITLH